jgi:DNA polymerase III delta subunit
MKIILLHGDDYQKSYERLIKFGDSAKKRDWKVERIDPSENIADILVSQSLFYENKLYVLEDFDKLNKGKLGWMKDILPDLDGTLVLYSKKTINKSTVKLLPGLHKEEEFKLPKIIWSFLDSFYPGNSTNTLKLFHKLIERDAPEFVFSLLVRQVRDMYYLKVAPDSLDYPSWRKNKLLNQMRKYKDGQLEKLIIKLSEADMKTKSSPQEISDLLDFIIITELK